MNKLPKDLFLNIATHLKSNKDFSNFLLSEKRILNYFRSNKDAIQYLKTRKDTTLNSIGYLESILFKFIDALNHKDKNELKNFYIYYRDRIIAHKNGLSNQTKGHDYKEWMVVYDMVFTIAFTGRKESELYKILYIIHSIYSKFSDEMVPGAIDAMNRLFRFLHRSYIPNNKDKEIIIHGIGIVRITNFGFKE